MSKADPKAAFANRRKQSGPPPVVPNGSVARADLAAILAEAERRANARRAHVCSWASDIVFMAGGCTSAAKEAASEEFARLWRAPDEALDEFALRMLGPEVKAHDMERRAASGWLRSRGIEVPTLAELEARARTILETVREVNARYRAVCWLADHGLR